MRVKIPRHQGAERRGLLRIQDLQGCGLLRPNGKNLQNEVDGRPVQRARLLRNQYLFQGHEPEEYNICGSNKDCPEGKILPVHQEAISLYSGEESENLQEMQERNDWSGMLEVY